MQWASSQDQYTGEAGESAEKLKPVVELRIQKTLSKKKVFWEPIQG